MPLTDTTNHLPLYQWQLQLMYVASLLLHISHPKVSYGYALYLNVAAHTYKHKLSQLVAIKVPAVLFNRHLFGRYKMYLDRTSKLHIWHINCSISCTLPVSNCHYTDAQKHTQR